MSRSYDVLAIGEVNVDLVSHEAVSDVGNATSFRRQLGGGPTNVAVTVARLGGRSAMVGRVGDDGFGRFARRALADAGVEATAVSTDPLAPTTTAIIGRSARTPDFLVHRGADARLDVSDNPCFTARAVHTSGFALSHDPAREAVLEALERAHGRVLTSLDPSYHPRVWGPHTDPFPILAAACWLSDLVKPSLDDCRRLFGDDVDPGVAVDHFLEWGAGAVLLTLGADGVLVCSGTDEREHLPAIPAPVKDVNGAGDVFLGGALCALLDGFGLRDAARAGMEVARRKVSRVGPLPGPVDRAAVYAAAGLGTDSAALPPQRAVGHWIRGREGPAPTQTRE